MRIIKKHILNTSYVPDTGLRESYTKLFVSWPSSSRFYFVPFFQRALCASFFLEWTSACILVPLSPSSRRWPDPFHCPVCPCCFSIWLAPVHLWWPSPGISSRNSHLLIKEIALPLQYSIPEQTSSLSQNISIIAIHVHQLNFEFLEDKGYIMYHVHVASVIVVPNTVWKCFWTQFRNKHKYFLIINKFCLNQANLSY